MIGRIRGGPLAILVSPAILLPLAACVSDMPTESPEPPLPSPVFLETSGLLPGGQGVLVSAGFEALQLDPARDEGGDVVPDRWTNLRVTVDGTEVDSRRFDATRMEFDVPVLPAGDVTIGAETNSALATMSGRLRGLLASHRVDDCAANDFTTLITVGDEVVLSLFCPADAAGTDWRLGYASVDPSAGAPSLRWIEGLFLDDEDADGMRTAVIHPGPSTRSGHFVARRPGPSSSPLDMWVWRLGTASGADSVPAPVEPLTCFPDASGDDVTSAVADHGGTCVAFQSGFLRRDATPIAECCAADARATFVLSSDGSAALQHVADVVVFDPGGRIVYRIPYGQIIDDVKFSRDGDRLFVVAAGEEASFLDVRDRQTSERLGRLELDGRIGAIAVVDDRLWLTREFAGAGAVSFAVELYDPVTLELRRAIALPPSSLAGPQDAFVGEAAVLRQNGEGTRLYLTSVVGGIVRTDVIEVF